MIPDVTIIPKPSSDLLGYLNVAQQVVGDSFLPRSYQILLNNLTNINKLLEVNHDESHGLWWFLTPILYDLFNGQLEFNWLKNADIIKMSVVVIPPPFISIVEQLQQELKSLGMTSSLSTRPFSRRFIGLLYGGFPWFESYLRICDASKLNDQQCTVLQVSSKTCDVPCTLDVFKKRRRNSFGQPLQMVFTDLPYWGVIRPFHVPARNETKRHIRATEIG